MKWNLREYVTGLGYQMFTTHSQDMFISVSLSLYTSLFLAYIIFKNIYISLVILLPGADSCRFAPGAREDSRLILFYFLESDFLFSSSAFYKSIPSPMCFLLRSLKEKD